MQYPDISTAMENPGYRLAVTLTDVSTIDFSDHRCLMSAILLIPSIFTDISL